MINAREMGLPSGVEILRFPYRGEVVQIPVAPSFAHLQEALRKVVLPALDVLRQAKKPGEIVDLGFTFYQSSADTFDFKNPEATRELIRRLKAAGLPVADKPKKLDPIAPERHSLISEMRNRADYYWPLPGFRDDTFIVGPVIVADIPRDPWIYDYCAEVEATRLQTSRSVAVHGETLLRTLQPSRGQRVIYNEEIVSILDRAIAQSPNR